MNNFRSSILILSLGFLIWVVDAKNIFDFFNNHGCPKYSSQPNVDLNKLTGIWYGLATNLKNPSASCPKVVISLTDNQTLAMDSSEILGNGSERKMKALFEIDGPELYLSFPIVDESLFGNWSRTIKAKTSVVYTDYEHIAVFFTCYETKRFIIPIANRIVDVVTRERNFDSLNSFSKALEPALNYGTSLREISFSYQGSDCQN